MSLIKTLDNQISIYANGKFWTNSEVQVSNT
jgi:hypothetical protein